MSRSSSLVEHAPTTGTLRLHDAFAHARSTGSEADLSRLARVPATGARDELLALLSILDLHTAPIDLLGPSVHLQHHPEVVRLKGAIERRVLARLRHVVPAEVVPADADAVVATIRAIGTTDLVPPVYEWVAEDADEDELRRFLALEGGPDGGFDDLVAVAQIGLSGEPKLEMARNYWDEMGRGARAEVHTELHHRMARALQLPAIERAELPLAALERAALTGVLSTNRWLQPELVGALGLIELQAGPRCRKVLAGLERIGAPPDALPFYDEHARTDPRHGKDWLDHVVAPLARDHRWARGMVRGARWRAEVNRRFFAAAAPRGPSTPAAA